MLWHLGYDKQGHHPEGRRLVFLGDLVDRGPDSPAVVELVKKYVESGRAQCVLGNHELNLLKGDQKDGNHWFTVPGAEEKYQSKVATGQQKKVFREFLLTLPLALANDELRVVHACWDHGSVARLMGMDERLNADDAYKDFKRDLNPDFAPEGWAQDKLDKLERDLKDMSRDSFPFMRELANHDAWYQNANPVRVLTSGKEIPIKTEIPFKAGGKWRMVERQKWWNGYGKDELPVIIGHYWRNFSTLPPKDNGKGGPNLFENVEPHHWMGGNKNVYCVDFSVGHRHKVRAGTSPEDIGRLAALRWPERVVMYDNGERSDLE